MNSRWAHTLDLELLADEAQVVGRFEVGNPVVEETYAVRPAKAIQFVEPDRPWRSRSPKSLKKSSNPPSVVSHKSWN